MARRKNASFTLDQTYGFGYGDRSLIQVFYARLNELCPGDMPIPIPPESQIHPQHDAKTQKYIFADYAVRKIAPLALRVVGLTAPLSGKLELQLEPITNEKTATTAASAASLAAAEARDDAAIKVREANRAAAKAAAEAAAKHPDAVYSAAYARLAVPRARVATNAADAVYYAYAAAKAASARHAADAADAVAYAASAAYYANAAYVANKDVVKAARWDNEYNGPAYHDGHYGDKTWAAVNEMLQAL